TFSLEAFRPHLDGRHDVLAARDDAEMADNCIALLRDRSRREKLARAGNATRWWPLPSAVPSSAGSLMRRWSTPYARRSPSELRADEPSACCDDTPPFADRRSTK